MSSIEDRALHNLKPYGADSQLTSAMPAPSLQRMKTPGAMAACKSKSVMHDGSQPASVGGFVANHGCTPRLAAVSSRPDDFAKVAAVLDAIGYRPLMRANVLMPCFLLLTAVGCAPANQEACFAYVEAQNEAYRDCGMDDRVKDPDTTCPATLNEGLNCVDYYERLADSFACENGEVTWDASGSCS